MKKYLNIDPEPGSKFSSCVLQLIMDLSN